MAEDNFKDWKRSIDSVSGDAFAITPSDTVEIDATRGLYVGTFGDIVAIMADSGEEVTFSNVQQGSIMPIRVKQVKATGTTAANIVGLL